MSLETRLATLIGAIGADIKDLQAASGGGGGGAATIIDEARSGPKIFDDFLVTPSKFNALSNGAGSSVTYPASEPDETSCGVLQLNLGTSSSGYALISTPYAAIQLGRGITRYVARVRIPVLSTNNVEQYSIIAGFNDAPSFGADGVYFSYESNYTPNWRLNTVIGGWPQTIVNTSVAVAANTWYTLAIEINAAGTSAEFFINGTSVGTITTNIPVAAATQTGAQVSITKAVGTTARTAIIDYMGFEIERTTLR